MISFVPVIDERRDSKQKAHILQQFPFLYQV